MLGPEQINFASRPTPAFLDGAASLRVTEQVAKGMGLRDNQIVRGIIEDRGGLLKLVLKNREFDWQGSKKLKPGDAVEFKVGRSAAGKLLSPLAHNIPAPVLAGPLLETSTPFASPRVMSLLYRPDQPSSLAQLLSPTTSGGVLSKAVGGTLGLLPERLFFTLARISPEMVRSALANSGLFGEYLLGHQLALRMDTKQLLRNLLRSDSFHKPDGISLDSAIDEIESRQLDGLHAQQNREVSYHFVMPFLDAEPIEMHFERGQRSLSKGENDWVINLHTNSADLGEVWSKTTIKGSSEVEMIFWAISESSTEMARQGKARLETTLTEFGLKLTKFSVLNASRPLIDPALTGPGQVVDVST